MKKRKTRTIKGVNKRSERNGREGGNKERYIPLCERGLREKGRGERGNIEG